VNSGLAIRPARSPMLILLIAFAVWVLATLRVPAQLVVSVASGAKIPKPVPVQVQRSLCPLVRQALCATELPDEVADEHARIMHHLQVAVQLSLAVLFRAIEAGP